MPRPSSSLPALSALGLALFGGAIALVSVLGTGGSQATEPTPTPSRSLAVEQGAPAAEATPSPTPTRAPPPPDTRTGEELAQPYVVDGLVVVSKEHRVSRGHVPSWADEPDGLHPDARAAFGRMADAAAGDGRTLKLRSGYRSYATQADSFQRAMRQYPEETARKYFAEPGASEHQTGLALDAWDGRNRGTAFAQTPEAAWLAEHAWEYGFIVRYPRGKEEITGYAWESWHLRWVGEEVARDFGPNSDLTLEEYLGLA